MLLEPFPCLRPRPDLAAKVAYAPFGAYDRAKAFAEAAANPLSFVSVDWPEALYSLEEEVDLVAAHARARGLLAYRLREGILVEDKAPALYHYRVGVSGRIQSGWVGRVPAEAFATGVVRPHEATLAGREADRAAHVRVVGAQTAPAFLMYRQTPALRSLGRYVREEDPLLSFCLPDGSSHEVWRLGGGTAPEVMAAFEEVGNAYVADGHHRAAAALSAGCQGVLCALFPSEELGVLPYDRLALDLGGLSPEGLVTALGEAGFSPVPAAAPVSPARKGELGLFCGGNWWFLSVPDRLRVGGVVGSLDVSALQEGVFGPLLGVSDPRGVGRLSFVGGGGPERLEAAVLAGEAAAAFSTFAPTAEEVMAVADEGSLMPPKSTWFDPKPYVGLFAMRICGEEGKEVR